MSVVRHHLDSKGASCAAGTDSRSGGPGGALTRPDTGAGRQILGRLLPLLLLLPACAPGDRDVAGQRAGTLFGAGTATPFGIGPAEVSSVTWGDLDRDGVLDLVTTAGMTGPELDLVYSWDGTTLINGTALSTGAGVSWSSAWGDVDNDGQADLAIATDTGYELHTSFGNALTINPFANNPVFDLEFGDCDEDGILELAYGGSGQTRVDVPDGSTNHASFNHTGSARRLAWGDFDTDGDVDLALLTDLGSIHLYENTTTGNCSMTEVTGTGLPTSNAEAIAWVHLGGGATPSLLIGINGDVEVQTWTGSQMQVSQPLLSNVCTSGGFTGFAVADVEMDGDADVVAACGSGADTLLRDDSGVLSVDDTSPAAQTRSVALGRPTGDSTPRLVAAVDGTQDVVWEPEPMVFTLADEDTVLGTPSALTWADQDDDGGLELIVGWTDGSIHNYQTPNAGLSSPLQIVTAGGPDPFQLAVAHLDADGLQDLAVAGGGASGSLDIYTGGGGGPGFFPTGSIASGAHRGVLVVNEGCDDDLDLLGIPEGSPPQLHTFNGSPGQYTAGAVLGTGAFVQSGVVGDFNGDGTTDVALGTSGSDGHWADGCGNGFTTAVWAPLNSARSMAAGDFDGDGDTDVAAGVGGGPQPISVFLNGPGQPSSWVGSTSGVEALAAGDVDGDGIDELAAVFLSGEIHIYKPSPTGALTLLWNSGNVNAVGGSGSRGLAFGDVDGDGDLDLASLHTNAVRIWTNNRLSPRIEPDNPAWVGRVNFVGQPNGGADLHDLGVTSTNGSIGIEVRLHDLESDPVRELAFQLYLPGAGWSVLPQGQVTGQGSSYATSQGGDLHTFTWTPGNDVISDGVRIGATISQQSPGTVGRSIPVGRQGTSSLPVSLSLTSGGGGNPNLPNPNPGQSGDPSVDDDGDGESELDGDCDDNDAAVNSLAGCRLCFQDLDEDFHGSNVTVIAMLSLDCYLQGYAPIPNDCNDNDDTIHGDAVEICDFIDQDCDGQLGFDNDGDGLPDCTGDAEDPILCGIDADGDGVGADTAETFASFGSCPGGSGPIEPEPDCDDADPLRSPTLPEICDGVDNDCDPQTSDPASDVFITVYVDADGDGWGTTQLAVECGSIGSGTYALLPGDCNDVDSGIPNDPDPAAGQNINPGQADHPDDGVDSDCDGTDTACFQDLDSDGWGGSAVPVSDAECTGSNYTTRGGDCDDTESLAHPLEDGEFLEVCDIAPRDRDWNCNGIDDDTSEGDPVAWYVDKDGDGVGDVDGRFGANTDEFCADPPEDSGLVGVPLPVDEELLDCEPTRFEAWPGAPELCNGLDDDCDGDVADGGPNEEVCDGVDNDCDGQTDEGFDADGDGFVACATGSGPQDCDDTDPGVNPGALEVCGDAVDNDCDGTEAAAGEDPDCWEGGCTSSCAVESPSGAPAWWLVGIVGLLGVRRRRARLGLWPVLGLVVALSFAPGAAQAASHEQLRATAEALRLEGKQREALLAYRAYIDAGGPVAPILAPWRGLERRFGEVQVDVQGEDPAWTGRATVSWEGGEVSAVGTPGALLSLTAVPVDTPLRLGISGSGLTPTWEDLVPLEVGELPRQRTAVLRWAGFGTLQVGGFDAASTTVSVHDGEAWREALPNASVAVTAGAVQVTVANADGTTRASVQVPAAGTAEFDPGPWTPVGLVLRAVPAGARVTVFVEGARSVIEADLQPDPQSGAVDPDSGLRLVPEVRLGSLVAGAGGIFLEHPRLGDGAWSVDLTTGDRALTIDWESLPGTAAIRADHGRWRAIHDRIERRTKAGTVGGVALFAGGSVGSVVLAILAVQTGRAIDAKRAEAQGLGDLSALPGLKDEHAALRTREQVLVGASIGSAVLGLVGAGVTLTVPIEGRARLREIGTWEPWPELR